MFQSVFHFLIFDSKEAENLEYDNPYHSNNRKYTSFANESRMAVATAGVRYGVDSTMTRLHRVSSRGSTSHLG